MYPIKRMPETKENVLIQHSIPIDDNGVVTEMEFLTFGNLEQTGVVKHLFSTRLGGASEGIFSQMNLSFTRGDREEHVRENYRRIARALDCRLEDFVCSDQTHTTNIRLVTQKDKGKGVTLPRDYTDVDGLVTNVPGIALATFYADCVPLYFVDKEHKAIGLAHSGWKGTIGGMGAHMTERMQREFGTRPEALQVAIGPSICRDCYEVSEDVAEVFQERFHGTEVVTAGKRQGKYQLDLWLANRLILQDAGIPGENIAVTDICTCHNPEYLFSHRASQGKRGNLGAFLMLKKS